MARKLDVLVLGINYAPEVTGVARYTTGMTRKLAADGHRVQVLTGFPHYPAWSFTPGYERGWRSWERLGDVLRLRLPLPRNHLGRGAAEVTAAGAGVLLPAADPALLLKTARTLAADPVAYEAMSRAGLAYAAETLDEDEALGVHAGWALSLVDRRRERAPDPACR